MRLPAEQNACPTPSSPKDEASHVRHRLRGGATAASLARPLQRGSADAKTHAPTSILDEERGQVTPAKGSPADGAEPLTPPLVPTPQALTARVCGVSDRGLQRDENEDAFVVADPSSGATIPCYEEVLVPITARGLLIAVCDGMGGRDNGALAASIATRALAQKIFTMVDSVLERPEDCLCRALKVVNLRIYEEACREFGQVGMGTTCTAGLLLPGRLVLAQIGDSRAYLHRKGTFRQLTSDQSLVATMLAAGSLTPEEAKVFPRSNIILQALGAREDVVPVISQLRTQPGDTILLESDGLHAQVGDEEIENILSMGFSPTDCARALVAASLEAGGGDNVTVVLARIGE
jgi:serine/threonine protein phosphatase PrpC